MLLRIYSNAITNKRKRYVLMTTFCTVQD